VSHNDKDPKLCAPATAISAELEIPAIEGLTTYGYRIVVLQTGSLSMGGNPGGYDNWRFGGPSFSRTANEGFVVFGGDPVCAG
jgi:hypothetical protein